MWTTYLSPIVISDVSRVLCSTNVEWFLKKKKLGTSACCAKLFKDPKSKTFLWNDAYYLGAGPPKILTVTLKWAKNIVLFNICKQNLFLTLFKK